MSTISDFAPQLIFSGCEPIVLAIFSLSSCDITTPTMLPLLSYIGHHYYPAALRRLIETALSHRRHRE